MKRAIIILVIIAAVGAGAGAYYMRRNSGEVQVNTATISRGEIIDTVGSTGTLQAYLHGSFGDSIETQVNVRGTFPCVAAAAIDLGHPPVPVRQADRHHSADGLTGTGGWPRSM